MCHRHGLEGKKLNRDVAAFLQLDPDQQEEAFKQKKKQRQKQRHLHRRNRGPTML